MLCYAVLALPHGISKISIAWFRGRGNRSRGYLYVVGMGMAWLDGERKGKVTDNWL